MINGAPVGEARKAEQPLQVADDFASEGANVVAPDKDAERHDAAEHDQRRPSQHFSETGHLPLLDIPDPTRCIAYRANSASRSSITLFWLRTLPVLPGSRVRLAPRLK